MLLLQHFGEFHSNICSGKSLSIKKNYFYFLVSGTSYYFCNVDSVYYEQVGTIISISSPGYPEEYSNKINLCPIYLNLNTTESVVLHIEYNTFTATDCSQPVYTLSNLSGQSLPNQIMRCSGTLHSNDVFIRAGSPFIVQLSLLRRNGTRFMLGVSG